MSYFPTSCRDSTGSCHSSWIMVGTWAEQPPESWQFGHLRLLPCPRPQQGSWWLLGLDRWIRWSREPTHPAALPMSNTSLGHPAGYQGCVLSHRSSQKKMFNRTGTQCSSSSGSSRLRHEVPLRNLLRKLTACRETRATAPSISMSAASAMATGCAQARDPDDVKEASGFVWVSLSRLKGFEGA